MDKITVDRDALEHSVAALLSKYSSIIYCIAPEMLGEFELDVYNIQQTVIQS